MLAKWLKEDLKSKFEKSNRVVLIDENQEYDWLIKDVCSGLGVKYYKVTDFVSDLEVKYKIEKDYQDKDVLIHTYINPSKVQKRHFMIQEYVATGEVFNQHLPRYISHKSGLKETDHKFTSEELLLAGRMSLKPEHNNPDYWDRLKHAGRKAIFGDFNKVILEFLAEPSGFADNLTDSGREIFYDLVSQYLDFIPEKDIAPDVVAREFANTIFNNILYNNDDTKDIYNAWLDSHRYRDSLLSYLNEFELPENFDIWKVNPNHPFKELDNKWLSEISRLAFNNEEIPEYMVKAIKKRVLTAEGMELANSKYWPAVYDLLNFKAKPAHEIEDLTDFIELYKNKLYQLDKSLRYIYQFFLDNKEILKGFKALYEEKMRPYLQKWFELFTSYRENQTNYLYEEIFSKDQGGIAVIVGDAISYEVSREIAEEYLNDSDYKVTIKIFNGNYPTTTFNNMSSLFGSMYTDSRDKREKALEDKLGQEIAVYELDQFDVNEIDPEKPTIIYGSDIDDLSEKGDESALKYYQTFIDTVKNKIKKLLDAGFTEVHLVTDHGFVCNFIIDEADKYSPPVSGKIDDRYILSNEVKENGNFIVKEKRIYEYNYIYFPKGINPIKSRGKYGFTHGGITPQELLLPHLKIKKESSSNLEVRVANKDQLKELTSNNFVVKLQAEDDSGLFKQNRKIILKIESDKGSSSQEIELKPGDMKEISFGLDINKYTITILDAESKERLDTVKGEKKNLRRGLDGLDIG